MKGLRVVSWSPYAAGAGIGFVSWFAFATVDRGIGITTAFEHSVALVGQALVPHQAGIQSYVTVHKAVIDWEWMLVLGVVLGSFISARLSSDRQHPTVPTLWRQRFGDSRVLRFVLAFIGGAVMMLGARMARGCTSGHGITGVLQLAVSSWVFIGLAFLTAIASAFGIYGRNHRDQTGGQ